MKNFEIEAVRADRYKITIDEEIWTEETLKEWSSIFHDVDLEGLAEALAFQILRFGSRQFYEGYGRVKFLASNGSLWPQYSKDYSAPLAEDEYCKGVTVQLLCEDEEHEFIISSD